MTYIPGSGSGGGSIATSSDVALNNTANSEVLTYDSGVGKWKNGTVSAATVSDLPAAVRAVKVAVRTVTANTTVTATDEYVRYDGTVAGTVTIPTHAMTALPVGTVITIGQVNTGQATLAPAAGVTLNGKTKTAEQHADIFAIKVGTDVWDLRGGIA